MKQHRIRKIYMEMPTTYAPALPRFVYGKGKRHAIECFGERYYVDREVYNAALLDGVQRALAIEITLDGIYYPRATSDIISYIYFAGMGIGVPDAEPAAFMRMLGVYDWCARNLRPSRAFVRLTVWLRALIHADVAILRAAFADVCANRIEILVSAGLITRPTVEGATADILDHISMLSARIAIYEWPKYKKYAGFGLECESAVYSLCDPAELDCGRGDICAVYRLGAKALARAGKKSIG
jgi:hypothetical protein